MSSSNIDISQEPKNFFLVDTMKTMALARYFIFVANNEAQGLQVLDGVISGLGESHQEALKETHDLVRRGSMTNGPKVNAREAFSKISQYLNKTHYCDYQIGVIPTSTLKATEDAPTEKIETRVKAKI